MILQLEHAPKLPGDSGGLGWGQRIGIAKKFPGDSGQGPHFQKPQTGDTEGRVGSPNCGYISTSTVSEYQLAVRASGH